MKSKVRGKDFTPITVNIPTKLLKEFDDRAKTEGLTRTSLLINSMRNYLDLGTAIQYMPQILNLLQDSKK